MDILKPILDIYDIKKDVLLFYLSPEIRSTVEEFEYLDDGHELFLNDKIIMISKSTGEIYKKGTIIKITEDKITIKNGMNISLPKNDYYTFRYLKRYKSKKNNNYP